MTPSDLPTGAGWGGTLRRLGDGQPIPGSPDPAADKERTAARMHAIVGELLGEERVRSGSVAPIWREVEHEIPRAFLPTTKLLVDPSSERTASRRFLRDTRDTLKQWIVPGQEKLATGETSDGSRWGLDGHPAAQARAAIAAAGQAKTWVGTEVEVTVGPTGKLSGVVVLSSGKRDFDRVALSAVLRAIERRLPFHKAEPTVSRWSVAAAREMPGPPVSIGVSPIGLPMPMLSLTALIAMAEGPKIRVRVELISVKPAG